MTLVSDLFSFAVSDQGVVRITLGNPPANALSVALMGELVDLAGQLSAMPEVRVVVVQSSVAGIFMAGADLNDVLDRMGDVAGLNALLRSALDAWERLPFPTIAAISGHALGGGCELALACDFRVMSRGRGRIGLPEVKRGLLAAGGGTQRVLRNLGRAAALDLVMRGRMLDADEAARVGLVTEAVDSDQLETVVNALVEEFLALPAMAVAAAKSVVLAGDDVTLSDGLTIEAGAMVELIATSADAKEGIASFLEKRPPVFTGN